MANQIDITRLRVLVEAGFGRRLEGLRGTFSSGEIGLVRAELAATFMEALVQAEQEAVARAQETAACSADDPVAELIAKHPQLAAMRDELDTVLKEVTAQAGEAATAFDSVSNQLITDVMGMFEKASHRAAEDGQRLKAAGSQLAEGVRAAFKTVTGQDE